MKPSIFSAVRKAWRLHCLYLKISLKYLAVYRTSTLFTVLFSTLFLVAEVVTVDVYYRFSGHIGDWDKGSFYILLGTFNIMICVYTYLFEIPHDAFVYKIRYGELDADLLKPMDAMTYVSVQKVDFASLFSLPIPVWLLVNGVRSLDLAVSLDVAGLYLVLLAVGVFMVYLVNQFFINWSFWTPDAGSIITVSDMVVRLGSRPLRVYPKLVQFSFGYLCPIILSTTLSVEVLQQQSSFADLLALLGAVAGCFVVVRLQWQWGLRRYASASS